MRGRGVRENGPEAGISAKLHRLPLEKPSPLLFRVSLVDVVDCFYDRLDPRNWIFHDLLNVSAVEAILDQTATCEEAEQRFIEIYRNENSLASWTRHLYSIDGLRERAHQIDRAREHYRAEQFDSAALHLIAVMDGFVSDFEPDVRSDLSSRDPDAMTAWDEVRQPLTTREEPSSADGLWRRLTAA